MKVGFASSFAASALAYGIPLAAYPGYTGELQITGTVDAYLSKTGNAYVTFQLSGVEAACKATPEGVANACGIHIHEGNCNDAAAVGGHYYAGDSDPWGVLGYNTKFGKFASGSVKAEVGQGLDIAGRSIVVHDSTGARVACASLPSKLEVRESDPLKVATWDGAEETAVQWKQRVDPVMGGKSVANYTITAAGTAKFSGRCNIVPSLSAPGFAQIVAENQAGIPDITGYENIALKVRSSTPEYEGFKIGFGAPGIPAPIIFVKQGEYKSEFNLTSTNDWQIVEVPLSYFSRDVSDYTGRCDSQDPPSFGRPGKQHYCCSASGKLPAKDEVCVEDKYLGKINELSIWAEGVEGEFDLEIEWVGATKGANFMLI